MEKKTRRLRTVTVTLKRVENPTNLLLDFADRFPLKVANSGLRAMALDN